MLRSSRRLSYEAIAGYEPGSMVTDHVRSCPAGTDDRW
jgi:hypothetical protein